MAFINSITRYLDNISIGRKILLISLILVIVPSLVIGYVAYSSAESAIKNEIKLNLKTQVSDLMDESDTVYDLTQNKVKSDLNVLHNQFYAKGKPAIANGKLTLGSSYIVNDNFEIVDNVQTLLGGVATVFQKEGDKAVRISTNVLGDDGKRAVGTSVSPAVYEKVVKNGETYFGTANVVGKNYITAYEPIKNSEGEIIGILFVGVEEASTIGLLQDQIQKKKIGENGYIYILNSTGYALLHPTLKGKDVSDLSIVKEILKDKEGYLEYPWEGKSKVSAYSHFKPFDWIIVASSDLSDFTGPLDTIRNVIILVVFLGILAGSIIAYLFGKSITRRMKKIVDLAHKVSEGDLSGDITHTDSQDEIGLLQNAFNEVVHTFLLFRDEISLISFSASSGDLNVRGNVAKFQGDYAVIIDGVNETVDAMAIPLQEAMTLCKSYAAGDFSARMNPDIHLEGDFVSFRDALNTIGKDVSAALTAVKSEIDELSERMNEVSNQVIEVNRESSHADKSIEDVSQGTGHIAIIAASVSDLAEKSGINTQQILSAMQDLATTVSSVAAKIEYVSVLTNNASELSEKGKEAAGQADRGMGGIIQSSSAIEKMNQEMNQQMEEIGRIVDIISSIADETNLLALNAALEAARAGDAGLGFAVVASEVKELASESQKSAENIARIISALQKKSVDMADAVNKSLTEVKKGDESVKSTLEVFNEIVSSISVINSNMSEVAAASEEQAASVEEVTATVNEFSGMIQKTAQESVDLATASEESSSAIGQIKQMVSQVNTSMDYIRSTTVHVNEIAEKIHRQMELFKL